MKKFLLFTMLLLSATMASAQTTLLDEEDTEQVEVLGYFCKNDTMKYLRHDISYQIENNDTIITSDVEEEFMIVVTDSTENGYTMQMSVLSTDLHTAKNDFERIFHETASEAMKNCPCIFTTNENGEFEHVKNWREIRDAVKACTKTALDRLFTEVAGLDSVMNRSTLESSLAIAFATEDGVKESYDELDLLFGLHGTAFDCGTHEEDKTANGFPSHTWLEAGYIVKEDEYDDDDDYMVQFKQQTRIPFDDAAGLGMDMMMAMLSTDAAATAKEGIDAVMKEMKEQCPEIVKTDIIAVDFSYNGWPKNATKVTDTSHVRRDITVSDIVWTYRSWNNF